MEARFNCWEALWHSLWSSCLMINRPEQKNVWPQPGYDTDIVTLGGLWPKSHCPSQFLLQSLIRRMRVVHEHSEFCVENRAKGGKHGSRDQEGGYSLRGWLEQSGRYRLPPLITSIGSSNSLHCYSTRREVLYGQGLSLRYCSYPVHIPEPGTEVGLVITISGIKESIISVTNIRRIIIRPLYFLVSLLKELNFQGIGRGSEQSGFWCQRANLSWRDMVSHCKKPQDRQEGLSPLGQEVPAFVTTMTLFSQHFSRCQE